MKKDISYSEIDEVLCENIIKHLFNKHDHQDNLEGLILSVSENEVKSIMTKLLNNLSYLISKGLIKEYKNNSGKRWYTLVESNK